MNLIDMAESALKGADSREIGMAINLNVSYRLEVMRKEAKKRGETDNYENLRFAYNTIMDNILTYFAGGESWAS